MNERTEHIRRLLHLYYNGESTLAQEAELKAFFAGPDVPPDMQADAGVFRALGVEPEVPEAVRRRVDSALGTIIASRSRRKRMGARIAAIAAGVAVLAAVGVGALRPAPVSQELSQDEAREQVEMAFTLLTSTVKKGCESINSL